MFYYRITKTTAASPRVTSQSHHQFAGWKYAGDYVRDLLAGGEYREVIVKAIGQDDYIAATRPGD